MNIDLYSALDITIRVAACGLAVSAFELMSLRQHFGPKGVFGLATIASLHSSPFTLRVMDRFIWIVLGIQSAASLLVVILGPFTILGRVMLVLSFIATLMTRWRRSIGGDGAEQMTMIVLAAAGLAVLPFPSGNRITIAVIFIVAQLCLSYLTAGIAKLISPLWRNGGALPTILSTYSHGHPWAASLLQQHPMLALLLSWSIIIFECLFPLLIFGPSWLALCTLVLGLIFHSACAVLMGLNSFLWSFPAIYPCVIAITTCLTFS